MTVQWKKPLLNRAIIISHKHDLELIEEYTERDRIHRYDKRFLLCMCHPSCKLKLLKTSHWERKQSENLRVATLLHIRYLAVTLCHSDTSYNKTNLSGYGTTCEVVVLLFFDIKQISSVKHCQYDHQKLFNTVSIKSSGWNRTKCYLLLILKLFLYSFSKT